MRQYAMQYASDQNTNKETELRWLRIIQSRLPGQSSIKQF
jgi:hypothetical protein